MKASDVASCLFIVLLCLWAPDPALAQAYPSRPETNGRASFKNEAFACSERPARKNLERNANRIVGRTCSRVGRVIQGGR